jgi:hypothetical protein
MLSGQGLAFAELRSPAGSGILFSKTETNGQDYRWDTKGHLELLSASSIWLLKFTAIVYY